MQKKLQVVRAPRALRRPGYVWARDGLRVSVGSAGGAQTVMLPPSSLHLIGSQAAAECGLGNCYGVSAPCYTVGGFFKKIGRAIKKAKKFVDSKTRKLMPRFVRKIHDKVKAVAKKIAKGVKKVVTHPVFRAGFGALATAFPVLAPAAAGLEIATQVINRVEKGKRAAQAILGGRRSPEASRAIQDATKAQKEVAGAISLAKRGSPAAQRFLGGLIAARGAM